MPQQRLYRRGQVWYCAVYVNGERQQVSTRCRDKAAAEAVARQLERDAANPGDAAARAETLGASLHRILTQRQDAGRAGTAAFYATKAGHLVRLLHQATPLRHLTRQHLDAYVARRRVEGVSSSTIHKELVTLGVALRESKRAGLWSGEVEQLLPRVPPGYRPRTRWLTVEEAHQLLEQLAGDRRARVAFLLATGATWSDTDRARWEDLQPASVLVRGLKTQHRWRNVPLELPAQLYLVEVVKQHAEGLGGVLFRPWTNVRRDIHAACARAGIPPCSPNDLRRTLGHWLRGAGVAPDLIGAVLGHADSRMVERVYGKIPVEVLAARIRVALGQVPTEQVSGTVTPVAQQDWQSEHRWTGETQGVPALSVVIEGKEGRVTGIEPATRGVTIPRLKRGSARQDAENQGNSAASVTPVAQRRRR